MSLMIVGLRLARAINLIVISGTYIMQTMYKYLWYFIDQTFILFFGYCTRKATNHERCLFDEVIYMFCGGQSDSGTIWLIIDNTVRTYMYEW